MLTEEEKDPARGEEESRDPQAAPKGAVPDPLVYLQWFLGTPRVALSPIHFALPQI